MLPSKNSFLLLKHLGTLTPEQHEEMRKDIVDHLKALIEGIANSKFSPEQMAEIKLWIADLGGTNLNIETELAVLAETIEFALEAVTS